MLSRIATRQNITVLLRRGNTEENDRYTGVEGTLTMDTQAGNLRLHDGVTAGGKVILTAEQVSNVVDDKNPIRIIDVTGK